MNIGSSWALPLTVGGKKINLIADTGNNQFTVLDLNYTMTPSYQSHVGFPAPGASPDLFKPSPKQNFPCLSLLEDGTNVVYMNRYNRGGFFSCYGATAQIIAEGITPGEQTVMTAENVSISSQFVTSHSAKKLLHDWGVASQGNIGMSFSAREYNASIFSQMVYETTKTKPASLVKSGVFGLDFNAAGGRASSLQVGGVKPMFAQNTTWARQGLNRPQYHNVMVKNLGTCNGRENLLGFAHGLNSYAVMVDTGQVCLALPAEMFDAYMGWFDKDMIYTTAAELPAISFQVDDGGVGVVTQPQSSSADDLLYIPAGNLLVDKDSLDGTGGSPEVTVGGVKYKLCLLRGQNVMANELDGTYNDNPQPIIFGSLVLQSVYFAADFHNTAVGLASKLSAEQVSAMYAATKCKAKAVCIGQQLFNKENNSCMSPFCSNYFFATIDAASQTCYNRLDLYNAGLAIVLFCVIFETVSYFLMQYSGLQVMGIDIDHQAFRYSRTMNTKVDLLTYHVGRWLSMATDYLIALLEPLIASGAEPRR